MTTLTSNKAFYYNRISFFLKDTPEKVLHTLMDNSLDHSFPVEQEQRDAWINQISSLQNQLIKSIANGYIIFEYDIVRMGKRIDVVLLLRHMVFSLEYKNGQKSFTVPDMEQAEDYAIDLKNFHKESENLYVCPILIATENPTNQKPVLKTYPDNQIYLQRSNNKDLINIIEAISKTYGDDGMIDFDKWFNSPYNPTPTIIDAAVTAYNKHDVKEIAHSEAGSENIELAEKTINEIIDKTKKKRKKSIIFLTGVPGAGKTLVGLDLATKRQQIDKEEGAIFLSGNGPLVDVLQDALARSAMRTMKGSFKNKNQALQATKSLIQSMYGYRDESIRNPNEIMHEHVVIFDEAQRVWNKEKLSTWAKKKRKVEINESEPSYLISVMDRRQDWACILCLVGLGQDIYDGETGINEWLRASLKDYSNWDIYLSEELFSQNEDQIENVQEIKDDSRTHVVNGLHLKISLRSYRSSLVSTFVDSVLSNEPKKANEYYENFSSKYPIYITRNLSEAKKWAKVMRRGSQRCGLMACSSAQRLRAEGLYVPVNIDVTNWFLAEKDDIRSSDMMEVVASEFKVQGLEIDWGVIGWDLDLRRSKDDSWDYFQFKGTKWLKRNQEQSKRYLVNSYRVLLTRSRCGFVIFVPHGCDVDEDKTRDSREYDNIYEYLKSCGIKDLPSNE
jgi:hypothetical protein